MSFQSRAGFSPFCDGRSAGRGPTWDRFNPVLGFLPSATLASAGPAIPRSSFNPVLGFLPSATWRRRSASKSSRSFNPVLGFLPSATRPVVGDRTTRHHVSIPCWVFSLLRPRTGGRRRQPNRVSIPCWVFSLLRPTVEVVSTDDGEFQSRAGFSPFCDDADAVYFPKFLEVSIPCWVFSLLRRVSYLSHLSYLRTVSIPCWVFSLLRLGYPLMGS